MREGKRIVMIGGGISGLSLAWRLQQRYGSAATITLIEASHRLGGWIQTIDHEGFLFELGPRACRSQGSGAATLQLIKDLELHEQIIQAAPAAKRRYLSLQGQLVPLRVMRCLLPALFREWSVPKAHADESIHAFISRRLGVYAANTLFDPLTVGIYAGDCRQLSMKSCFPQLWEWEQQHGSLTRGWWNGRATGSRGLFTLRRGMEQLVQELAGRLECELLLGRPAAAVERTGVRLCDGTWIPADACFLTVPAYVAADLLAQSAPEASALLADIAYATVTVVNLGYVGDQLQQQGFGYLTPTWQCEDVLGMVWDSSVFPQHNRVPQEVRVTVMLRGEPAEALAVATEEVRRYLAICRSPDAALVTVCRRAIPQYAVGHSDRLAKIQAGLAQKLPQVWLSSTYAGVSVNDCIARSTKRS